MGPRENVGVVVETRMNDWVVKVVVGTHDAR